jgi:hypothetical protein
MKVSRYLLALFASLLMLAPCAADAQTYTLSPVAKQSFTDSNGDPIPGGKICTFLSGTTTPATTYTDTAGTPNTNPIILSAAGRPTNGGVEVGIYLAAGSSYKFVLLTAGTDSTCATGSTVWTQDAIPSVPSSGSSVDIPSAVAGEAITIGQCVFLSDGSGSKTSGRWYRCDAANSYSSTLPEVGIALATVTTGQMLIVRTAGSVTGLSGLSIGAEYYVSGTVGGLTSTAPANRRHLGHADTTTSLVLTGNPSSATWTTVTTTSTGTQNDFAPGLVGNTIVRCNNATLLTITGLAAGYDGQHVKFESIGAGQVDFPHQSASSSAANRQINFATLGNTSLAAGSGVAEYVYDATTARWRLTSHDQGAWIAFTPAFVGPGATYTTQQGFYLLRGRTVAVNGYLALSVRGSTTGQIAGLPYVAAAAPLFNAASIGQMNSMTTTWVSITGYVGASGQILSLVGRQVAAASVVAVVNADLSNTTDCVFAVTYPVS